MPMLGAWGSVANPGSPRPRTYRHSKMVGYEGGTLVSLRFTGFCGTPAGPLNPRHYFPARRADQERVWHPGYPPTPVKAPTPG